MEIVKAILETLAMFVLACIVAFVLDMATRYFKTLKNKRLSEKYIINFDRDSPDSIFRKYPKEEPDSEWVLYGPVSSITGWNANKNHVKDIEARINALLKVCGYVYYSTIYEALNVDWNPKMKNVLVKYDETEHITLHYNSYGLVHIKLEEKHGNRNNNT